MPKRSSPKIREPRVPYWLSVIRIGHRFAFSFIPLSLLQTRKFSYTTRRFYSISPFLSHPSGCISYRFISNSNRCSLIPTRKIFSSWRIFASPRIAFSRKIKSLIIDPHFLVPFSSYTFLSSSLDALVRNLGIALRKLRAFPWPSTASFNSSFVVLSHLDSGLSSSFERRSTRTPLSSFPLESLLLHVVKEATGF